MQAGTFQDIYTNFDSFSKLRHMSNRGQDQEALQVVARQFEGVFLQTMLKSMRDADFGNPLFDNSSTELYRDMLDQQLVAEMSQSNSLGIADLLVRQLKGSIQQSGTQAEPSAPIRHKLGARSHPSATRPPSKPPIPTLTLTPTLTSTKAQAQAQVPAQVPAPVFESPQDFIETMLPEAEGVASRHGLDPRLLVAQAALETGWGRALMQRPDGRSAFNLFGIKADNRWPGESAVVNTLEYTGGVAVKQRAAFRAYNSFAESFDDYIRFLNASPRYSNALAKAEDPSAYIRELQAAGYATDPRYADKVMRILNDEIHPHVAGRATHSL